MNFSLCMKCKTVMFLLFIFTVSKIFAQTPDIERLLEKANQQTGKEKIITLAEICKNFYSIDPNKGILYGKEALHLADSLKILSAKSTVFNNIGAMYLAISDFRTARAYFDSALANAQLFKDSLEIAIHYNRMGLYYEASGVFDSSLFVFKKELSLYKIIKNDERTGTSLENIGTIYMNRGELQSAMTYLIDAEKLFVKTNNAKKLPYTYLKIGQIYAKLNDFTIAEKYFQKGIDQSIKLNDPLKAGMGLNALGILYQNQKKYDSAIAKYEEALKTIQNLKNKNLIMAIYGNMGVLYKLKGEYQKALNYHQKSLDMAMKLNLPVQTANAQFNLGEIHFVRKDYQQARSFYERSLATYTAGKIKSNMITVYNALIKVNDSLKDYANSVKYYRLFIDLTDSLNKTELNSSLDSLKIKFHTEQTERDNLLLKQDKEIQAKTISLQKVIMWSILTALILIITLAFAIIRSRQKIKKTNKLLEEKNIEISLQSDELGIINTKLQELMKFKDSMNSFLVHDLKNPLNTIINILPGENPENQTEIIRQSGKHMLNIVTNLLDISKYEEKAMKLAFEEISLTSVINHAYDEIQYQAEKKSIRLHLNYTFDVILKADPGIIERVFINLFTNAIRFSHNGGAIRVFTEPYGTDELKIKVNDQGDGIDPEHLPFIFDKFIQGKAKSTGYAGSTGIGLTFCRLAIESHGGEIGVESKAGEGSSFWFTLPMAENQNNAVPVQDLPERIKDESLYLQLSEEEKVFLSPFTDRLRNMGINQISDVKDVLKEIDTGSTRITLWKSKLQQAVFECNEIRFKELINL